MVMKGDENMDEVVEAVRQFMKVMEENYGWKFNEEEWNNTPLRVKAMFEEWKKENEYNRITEFDNVYKYGNMVIIKGISFQAFCSHHLLPFFGEVIVGYIPHEKGKVYGASKLIRMVRRHSYKPQVQERLTEEIADEIYKDGEVKGVMVVMKAKHLCMVMRGVKDVNSELVTSSIRGVFEKEGVRQEFLSLVSSMEG